MKDVTLWHGDCLNLMPYIPNESINLILCDLPYGITANKWDSIIPLDQLWSEYERIIKPNGAIVLFGSGMFTAKMMLSNPKLWRYNLIWQKTTPTGFLNAKRMFLRSHEDIMVFYKKQPTYNPQKTFGHQRKVSSVQHKSNCNQTENYYTHGFTNYDSTERYPKSVLTFKTDKQKSALHPTQKPVDLLKYLIMTYTNEGEKVLDNCMGSGSTGVACANTGREFIGIELNENYFNIACKRIEEAEEQLKSTELENMLKKTKERKI